MCASVAEEFHGDNHLQIGRDWELGACADLAERLVVISLELTAGVKVLLISGHD